MVIFYCFIFLTLWTLGTVMLVNNPRNAHVRWFSAFVYIMGFASFSVVLHVLVLPWMRSSPSYASETIENIRLFTMVTWGIEYHSVPYFLLMCALVFTRIFSRRAILLFALATAVPIVIYLAAVPPLYPELQLGHPLFRAMSGIYFVAGLAIYWLRYANETTVSHRRNSFRTAFAITPCMAFLYVTDYAGMEHFLIKRNELQIVSNNLWQYNFLIVLFFITLFIFYSLKYGFMGIKLRIEKQKIDYSMKNLTQGALILNHTIKNEIQKVNYLSGRMRSAVADNDMDSTLHNLDSLDRVAEHLLQMMNQIKERTDEIVLQEQEHRLADLLEFSLRTLETMFHEKQIVVSRDAQADPILLCDGTHIREVLGNMLINAMDAMTPGNGRIEISIMSEKKDIVIWVKDNGAGISKENAARMFDPFFTTKKGRTNYGLGLNYCYAVMQKHGGTIRLIESTPGQGTWMELRLPAKRVRHIAPTVDHSTPMRAALIEGESTNGREYQGHAGGGRSVLARTTILRPR